MPWLLPTHASPWTTFYQEVLAAIAAVAVGAWAVKAVKVWRLDFLTTIIACTALVPLLQAGAGLMPLPAEAPLVFLYLFGVALLVLVARHAEEAAPGRLIEAVLAGLLIAALLSTGLAFYQWLGGDSLGVLAAPIPFHDRPVANVGQPNNLATLLVWGLIASWWAHLRQRIGGTGAVLAAAFLLAGITLTQSRAGAIQVGLLLVLACCAHRTLRTAGQAPAFAGLALWWMVCLFAFEPLTELWTEQLSRPMLDLNSPRERTMLLKTVLLAIGEHPWIGYGWYQNVPAHVAVAGRTTMHGLIANSHNIALDLVIWNGLPLGTALIAGLVFWYWRAARCAVTPEQVLLLLALGTFCVHANLELPHVFAYFLVPVAVMMGTLGGSLPLGKVCFVIPRPVIAVVLLLFGAVLVELFLEYRRIETNLTDARMRAAHIARAPAAWDPKAHILGSLQEWVTMLQVEPSRGMQEGEIAHLRRTVTRYPTSLGLLRYAEAAALNGHPEKAVWALGVLCNVHPDAECKAAADDWANLSADGRPELATIAVPVAPSAAPR